MHRRRTIILIFGSFVLLALVVPLICMSSPEPIYDGKRLSEWLTEYERCSLPDQREKPGAALRALESKAMPLVFRWVQYEPYESSRWRIQFRRIVSRLPGLGGMNKSFDNDLDQNAWGRAWAAAEGFSALGRGKTNLGPALVRIANNTDRPYCAFRAVSVLYDNPEFSNPTDFRSQVTNQRALARYEGRSTSLMLP